MTEGSLVETTIALLDRFSFLYKHESAGAFSTYDQFAPTPVRNEKTFIQPKLFPDFLQEVLGFSPIDYIPEQRNSARMAPDFTPLDTSIHPFIFETKGFDSSEEDLRQEYASKSREYLRSDPHAEFAVITNMRELVVFSKNDDRLVQEFSFSFLTLYRGLKSGSSTFSSDANTARFLAFVSRFHRVELTVPQAIEAIERAHPHGEGPGAPELLAVGAAGRLTKSFRQLIPRLVSDVAERANSGQLKERVLAEPERLDLLLREIAGIAADLEPSTRFEAAAFRSGAGLERLLTSTQSSVKHVVDVYYHRIAHFILSRLLLLRVWEDSGFVDPAYASLYNGGFKKWYEALGGVIEKVLDHAYQVGREKYVWLFTDANNYAWYVPTERVLVDTLYELAKYDLSSVDRDVLGTVYEDYLDIQDKKNKGQYYTPHAIVSFIWDRVGYTSTKFDDDRAFWGTPSEGRRPRLIYDPASGSGSFPVEAIARLRAYATLTGRRSDLLNARRAVLEGVHASEISPFAYYLTEINMLIQLAPLIQKIIDSGDGGAPTAAPITLRVLQVDSLGLHNPPAQPIDETSRVNETGDSILPVWKPEGEKARIFDTIKDCAQFDYVVANPPYIGEDSHKELFRTTLERFPYWRNYYLGKMDYLYFFVILGVSKLRPGGKLGFVTTSYWLTADGAAKLRRYILDEARIVEVIDFNQVKLFEHARGQHNLVFVLQRREELPVGSPAPDGSGQTSRAAGTILVARVKKPLSGSSFDDSLTKTIDHLCSHLTARSYEDEFLEIRESPVRQESLTDGAWHLFSRPDVDQLLDRMKSTGTPLSEFCEVNQGVVPNPLRVDQDVLRRLPHDALASGEIHLGDGVFVLSPEEVEQLGLSSTELALIKPYIKNTDVHRYFVDPHPRDRLIYTDKDTRIRDFPRIERHLQKFQAKLSSRRETLDGKIPWFSLHWARERRIFEGSKIVCPYRTSGTMAANTFGYSDSPLYGSSDLYFITPNQRRSEGLEDGSGLLHPSMHELLFILGVLNSAPLTLWAQERTKAKGEARELFSTPVRDFPIPRMNTKDKQSVASYRKIIDATRCIVDAKKKLSEMTDVLGKGILNREGNGDVSVPEVISLVGRLPREALEDIEHSPQVAVPSISGDFAIKTATGPIAILDPSDGTHTHSLTLNGARRQTVVLLGSFRALDLIRRFIEGSGEKVKWGELLARVRIPKCWEDFDAESQRLRDLTEALLEQIASSSETIDSETCNLFGVDIESVRVLLE